MRAVFISIIIAAVIIFGLVLAPYIIPTAPYRQLAIDTLSLRTGTKVTLESMRIQFLPYISYNIRDITFSSQDPNFKGDPIASIKSLKGTFSILDILRRRLKTDITAEGLTLSQHFDSVLKALATPLEKDPMSNWRIGVDSIRIRNSVFKDTAIKELSIWDLNLGERLSGRMSLKTSNMDLSGLVYYDLPASKFDLRNGKIAIAGISATLDAAFLAFQKPFAFEIHAATPEASFQQLSNIFTPLKTGFSDIVSWAGLAAVDLYLSGSDTNTEISLQAELINSNIELDHIFKKPQGRPMKLNLKAKNGPTHLNIENMSLTFGKSVFYINGFVLHQPDHKAQLNIYSPGFVFAEISQSIPAISLFESLDQPALRVTLQGSLNQNANRTISGNLVARSARIADTDLNELKVDFTHDGFRTTLPLINAIAYGGTLSANGNIEWSNPATYMLQAVIKDLDLGKLPRLNKIFKGKGTLVGEIQKQGSALSGKGTLLAKDLLAPALTVGTSLLGGQTWKTIESQLADTNLEVIGLDSLAALDPSIKSFHASFNLEQGVINITDLRYTNPKYILWMHGTLSPQGWIDSTGSIWLTKTTIKGLISSPTVRAKITNKSGELQIPFSLKGKGDALLLRLAQDELARLIKEESNRSPKIGSSKPSKTEPKKVEPSRSRRIPPSQTDDILKVHVN